MRADAEVVYRELSATVLGYLRASGAREADDVLGEVFVQVARDLHGFAGAGDPAAVRRWVFAIARHRMIDASRRASRRPQPRDGEWPREEEVPPPGDGPDPELVAGLQLLTVDQREVVALRFVADLPLEEVAEMTGRTVGAVKALQHRALENLRSAVSLEHRPAL